MVFRYVLALLIGCTIISADSPACGVRRVLHIDASGNKRILEDPVIIDGKYARGACGGSKVAYVDPITGEKIVVNEIVYDKEEQFLNPNRPLGLQIRRAD